MRGATILVAIAGAITLLIGTMNPAEAWYDRWGRWHPNHPGPGYYYRPPPPVYYPPRAYYRPPPPVYGYGRGYGGPGVSIHIP